MSLILLLLPVLSEAENSIKVQNVKPRLTASSIQELFYPNVSIYILNFDSNFFDVSGTEFPLVIDEFSDGKLTRDVRKLKLHEIHFGLHGLIGLAVLGNRDLDELSQVAGLMCDISAAKLAPDYPDLLNCPVQMSNEFYVLANAHSMMDMRSAGDFKFAHRAVLGRFSHSVLVLWYEEAELRRAKALCMHCNGTSVMTDTCQKIDNNGAGNDCAAHARRSYMATLAAPGPCGFTRWPKRMTFQSPFHKSTHEAVDILGCRRAENVTNSVLITLWLLSIEGNYPAFSEVLLKLHSQPAYVFTFDSTIIMSTNGRNPYMIPFSTSTWALLLASMVGFSMTMGAIDRAHTRMMRFSNNFAKVFYWSACVLLDQIGNIVPSSSNRFLTCKRVLALTFVMAAIILNNHYRGALHSEFAVTSESTINIKGIEYLGDYKIYFLFDGEQCDEFQEYRTEVGAKEAGNFTCFTDGRNGITGDCTFIQQAKLSATIWRDRIMYAGTTPKHMKRLENVARIYKNMSYACVQELPEIFHTLNDSKAAFVAPEGAVSSTWSAVRSILDTNPRLQFAFKQDSEASFFVAPNGLQLTMRLASHQVWVRRKLRALFSSGLQFLWEKWERKNVTDRSRRLWEDYLQRSRIAKPISLRGSWILMLFYACAGALLLAFVAWVIECAFGARRH